MKNSKDACLSFLGARTEADALAALADVREMADQRNWRALNGDSLNWGVVSNQQSDAAKAATELMTNMVDAILLMECQKRGIGPRDALRAPANMYEAVRTYFPTQFPDGRLVNVTSDTVLRDFGRANLVIDVSGHRTSGEGHPSFTFADAGEGQHPDEFERTFLSFRGGQKSGIRFVQGRFNQGSSGVLTYSGRHYFKLIVSRRFRQEDHLDGNPWGWTLLRKREGGEHDNPVIEYFAPGGRIARFAPGALHPVHLPEESGGGFDTEVAFEHGTFVKVFDYQIDKEFINFAFLRRMFDENIVDALLPFRIFDSRYKPKNRELDERTFSGMEHAILRGKDSAGNGKGVLVGATQIDDEELGSIVVRPYYFADGDLPLGKGSTARIFHHVNGQVHFKMGGFMSRWGLPALKDRLVVVVDATNLRRGARDAIWKGDREGIKRTTTGRLYEARVQGAVEGNQALLDLQAEILRAERAKVSRTGMDELFTRLAKRDRRVLDLVAHAGKGFPTLRKEIVTTTETPTRPPGDGDAGEVASEPSAPPPVLRDDPTRIDLVPREWPLELPLGGEVRASFETDARDDFAVRTTRRGTFSLQGPGHKSFRASFTLRSGKLTARIAAAEGVEAGKLGTLRAVAVTHGGVRVESAPFEVVVTEAEEKAKRTRKKGRNEAVDAESGAKLPPTVYLTSDGRDLAGGGASQRWDSLLDVDGFGEEDGGFVRPTGEAQEPYMLYLNYDNVHHLAYREAAKPEDRDFLSTKYMVALGLQMVAQRRAFEAAERAREGRGDAGVGDMVEFTRRAGAGVAISTMPLLDVFHKLDVEKTGRVEVTEDGQEEAMAALREG